MLLTNEICDLVQSDTFQEYPVYNLENVLILSLAEANSHLKRLQSDSGVISNENKDLLGKLEAFSDKIQGLQQKQTKLFHENESLKEKLYEAHSSQAQLTTEVSELHQKHEECSLLWKEAQEEIQSLREKQLFSSPKVDTWSNSSVSEANTGVGDSVLVCTPLMLVYLLRISLFKGLINSARTSDLMVDPLLVLCMYESIN